MQAPFSWAARVDLILLNYHITTFIIHLKFHSTTLHSTYDQHTFWTFSPTTGLTTTPAPITLTGPNVTADKLITSVTSETTSVFI